MNRERTFSAEGRNTAVNAGIIQAWKGWWNRVWSEKIVERI